MARLDLLPPPPLRFWYVLNVEGLGSLAEITTFLDPPPSPSPLLLALHMDLILVQRPSFFWTFLLLLLLAAYIIKTMALPQLSSSTRLRPLVEYGPQGKPNIEC